MKRFWYTLLYTLFALIVPLIGLNAYFPFITILSKPLAYKIGVFGTVAVLIVLVFFRKHILKWVRGFDRVTAFRGIAMWITYVFPSVAMFGLIILVSNYSETFIPVFGILAGSHLIAGVFDVLKEKAKVDNFKKWVNK